MATSSEAFFSDRDWSIHEGSGYSLYCRDGIIDSDGDRQELLNWIETLGKKWEGSDAGRGRRNTVAESPLGDEQWFMKQYHHGGLLAGGDDVVYASNDRFLDELRATLLAQKAGIRTPTPQCLLVKKTGDGFQGFFISRYLADAASLGRVVRRTGEVHYLGKAATALADLHDRDIDHLDYHLGNLLVDSGGEIVVTDFDPVQFRELSTLQRARRVHRFNRSLRKTGFLEDDCTVFSDRYYDRTDRSEPLLAGLEGSARTIKDTASDLLYWARDRDLEAVDLQKILIRAPNWLGDAVMSLPLLERLGNHEDVGQIDVVARSFLGDLYECHDAVSQVWELPNDKTMTLPDEIQSERYSSLVVIPKSFRTGYQAFNSGIPRRIGFATQGRGVFLTDRIPLRGRDRSEHHARLYMRLLKNVLDPSDRIPAPTLSAPETAKETVESQIDEPFITIHPGSAYGPAKRWPTDQFMEFLRGFMDRRTESVVAVGVEEEKPLADEIFGGLPDDRIINKVGETSLQQVMAYLQVSRGTVANDSGIMHLSAGLGTPTLGIFGSSNPDLTEPLGHRTAYVYEGVECSPCFEKVCPLEEDRYKCLTRIEGKRVLNQFVNLLG